MRARLRFAASAALCLLAPAGVRADPNYAQTNLVSDLTTEGAAIVDPNLKNPWGISFTGTSPFWISNAGSGTSTLYSDAGGVPSKVALTVAMPNVGGVTTSPTGQVAISGQSGFQLPAPGGGTVSSSFIFAGQNGTIAAWNPGSVGGMNNAITEVNNSASHADYTGLGIGTVGGSSFLYAANTAANTIDVFNSSFQQVSLHGNFTDPNAIAGYTAYNSQVIGNDLFVTYGNNAAGHGTGGYVDEFDLNGNFIQRIATNDTLNGPGNGTLNDPWGMALAPSTFGKFGGDLLVADLVDSKINAYNISGPTPVFEGQIAVDTGVSSPFGLWGIAFGNGVTGDANTLYFTAGIDGYQDGLFGALTTVPEPASIVSASLALLAGSTVLAFRRRHARQARDRSGIGPVA